MPPRTANHSVVRSAAGKDGGKAKPLKVRCALPPACSPPAAAAAAAAAATALLLPAPLVTPLRLLRCPFALQAAKKSAKDYDDTDLEFLKKKKASCRGRVLCTPC